MRVKELARVHNNHGQLVGEKQSINDMEQLRLTFD